MRSKRRIVVAAGIFATLAFSINTVCTRSAPTQSLIAKVNDDSTRVLLKDIRAFCSAGQSLFAGSYEGGVFRSNDNGESWSAVNAGLTTARGRPGPCVLSLAVSGNAIFAGTGYNQGIFRSTDNGESWSAVNTGLPFDYPLTLLDIPAMIVHGNALFAGTGDEGISISVDNGKSWNDASAGLSTYTGGGFTWKNGAASFVECGSDLFAGTYGGVFRLSRNCGAVKWVLAGSGLAGSALGVIKLAAQGSTLFAATLGGVYRSVDKGASWKWVSRDFPDQIIESVFVNETGVFASTQWNTYLSRDSGATWAEIESGLLGQDVRSCFQSGNAVFAGTQVGGVLRSGDGGMTWSACNNVVEK
jgi:photosystem II stability/assembly factor-like uncharacterized protein